MTILLFLYCIEAIAVQHLDRYAYFEIENKEAVWAYIYEDQTVARDELRKQLVDHFKNKPWVANIEHHEDDLLLDIRHYIVEYKKLGGHYMGTPLILRSGQWNAKARINIKDGRYRVLVYGLHYTVHPTQAPNGKVKHAGLANIGTFSDIVLTEGRTQFKKSKLKTLHLMSRSLSHDFALSESPGIHDKDW